MACRSPAKFLLARALPLCLLFGADLARAQSPSAPAVNNVFIFLPLGSYTFELATSVWVVVGFDRAVAVTGAPELELTIGTQKRPASFIETLDDSDTSVYFRYTVQASDSDSDGVGIAADALTLNGGAIKSSDGTVDALLDLGSHAISGSSFRKVDGRRETTPTVRRVSVSSPPSGNTFRRGQTIVVRVWFNRAVAVTGTPQLALTIGTRVRQASFRREDDPARISPEGPVFPQPPVHFRYTVESSDSDANGLGIRADALTLNGGTIKIRDGTTDAALDLGSHLIANSARHRVDGENAGEDDEDDPPPDGNQAPRVLNPPPSLEIDVGETGTANVDRVFRDPELGRLSYSASSEDDFISVQVAGSIVSVRGTRPGNATVTIVAEDPGGRTATATLHVAIGALLSLPTAVGAPEGGTVVVALELSRPLQAPIAVPWRLATDDDASTADADAADYGEATGVARIPVGETIATVEIPIADDADIEPAREHFVVQFEKPENENIGWAGNASAEAVIQEGVCDRTPAIRDELSLRWQDCHWPKPLFLTTVRSLDLSRRNIDALRSKDLFGLHDLRRLDLSDNALEALPSGLFAGVEGLREVSLEGNPGAPFALTVELVRMDAEPWAPGPAQIAARTEWAAPFDLMAALSASPAELVANALPATVNIAAGATTGQPFRTASNNGALLILHTAAAPLPSAQCGGHICFRGFQTAPGPTLTLFRQPPRALPIPELAPLQSGNPLRLPLATLVEAEDPLTELDWTATSSDNTLATARIADGNLEVTPQLASTGTAEITLVATDTAGFSTTLRFNVHVEFHWPNGPTRGWRSTLGSDDVRP